MIGGATVGGGVAVRGRGVAVGGAMVGGLLVAVGVALAAMGVMAGGGPILAKKLSRHRTPCDVSGEFSVYG